MAADGVAPLLRALQSADNSERRSAEAALEQMRAAPNAADALPAALAAFLLPPAGAPAPPAGERQFAAVLMRRLLLKGQRPLWAAASPPTRAGVKRALVDALGAQVGGAAALAGQTSAPLRRALCEVIASVADAEMQEFIDDAAAGSAPADVTAAWPELWAAVNAGAGLGGGAAAAAPGAAEAAGAAFFLLEQLAPWVVAHVERGIGALQALLMAAMGNAAAPLRTVRYPAARAAASLVVVYDGTSRAGATAAARLAESVLPPIMQLLALAAAQAQAGAGSGEGASAAEDGAEVSVGLAGVIHDVCNDQTAALRPFLREVVEHLCALASDARAAAELRQLCLECVVAIADRKPALARRLPGDGFLALALPAAARMLLLHGAVVDESADGNLAAWERRAGAASESPYDDAADDETEGEGRLVHIGEEALERS